MKIRSPARKIWDLLIKIKKIKNKKWRNKYEHNGKTQIN